MVEMAEKSLGASVEDVYLPLTRDQLVAALREEAAGHGEWGDILNQCADVLEKDGEVLSCVGEWDVRGEMLRDAWDGCEGREGAFLNLVEGRIVL